MCEHEQRVAPQVVASLIDSSTVARIIGARDQHGSIGEGHRGEIRVFQGAAVIDDEHLACLHGLHLELSEHRAHEVVIAIRDDQADVAVSGAPVRGGAADGELLTRLD